ncbi:MAG: CinA family protein, partial [Porticoccaceae bacterium]
AQHTLRIEDIACRKDFGQALSGSAWDDGVWNHDCRKPVIDRVWLAGGRRVLYRYAMITGPLSATTRQAAELGALLAARDWRVTCAESCTGGGVAAAITAVPGSSRWFEAGFVSYANSAKERLLDVRPATLAAWGAVSEAVVEEMARGALRAAGADLAVAVSGIAGPDGGSPDKPVGTVWFAWATASAMETACHRFPGDRDAVRQQAVAEALRGLIRLCRNTV